MGTDIDFGDMEAMLEKLANMASAIEGIGSKELKKALEFGAQEAEPLAQEYALRNYNKSSVVTRSGDLKSAVSNGRLLLVGGRLNYSLEPDLSEKFYIRANAVEYGSLRTPEGNKGKLKNVRNIKNAGFTTKFYRNIGDKKRAKVKQALQGKIDKSNVAQKVATGLTLDTGSVKVSKLGSVSGQTSMGKVTVTKAIEYFKLSSRQQAVIVNEVVKEAWFFIENLIGRKVK